MVAEASAAEASVETEGLIILVHLKANTETAKALEAGTSSDTNYFSIKPIFKC